MLKENLMKESSTYVIVLEKRGLINPSQPAKQAHGCMSEPLNVYSIINCLRSVTDRYTVAVTIIGHLPRKISKRLPHSF